MALRLIVTRVYVPQPGISATLWSEDRDVRLLDWKEFQAEGTFGIWLAGLVGKHGRGNIKVDWTDQLRSDPRLAPLLRRLLEAAD